MPEFEEKKSNTCILGCRGYLVSHSASAQNGGNLCGPSKKEKGR